MLAIIGGSGLYELNGLDVREKHDVETPFGLPSDTIIQGVYKDQDILFLARHGKGHKFLPHEVNYRANIYALKSLGALKVLGLSAAGSLRKDIKPGDLALAAQYFDHTRGKRDYTFFGRGIAGHVSMANPACPALSRDIKVAAEAIRQVLHVDKAYGCVEGPRLGTRQESFFLRDHAKCDLVGMTNVPEVFLAREAQMSYATICAITDYDCWMDDPSMHVSVEKFFETYSGALEKVKAIITALLDNPLSDTPDDIRGALSMAILTSDEAMSDEQTQWMSVLRA